MNRLAAILLQAQDNGPQWAKIYQQASLAQDAVNMLCWFLAAIFGAIGTLKVYNKWQLHSHHHVQIDAEITIWFGGCLFFIIAHFCVGIIFGLQGKGF